MEDPGVEFTVGLWSKTAWNPPAGYDELEGKPEDQSASPKPSHSRIVFSIRKHNIDQEAATIHGAVGIAGSQVIEQIANRDIPASAGIAVVGGGIERMPAIAHLAEAATLAGASPHYSVLQSTDGAAIEYWTEAAIRALLEPLSRNKNQAENAKNIVVGSLKPFIDTILDENGGLHPSATELAKLEKREEAHTRLMEKLEQYPILFEAALKRIANPSLLPADLPTRREVLIERLEGHTMARIKGFKRAISQQGVDIAAACDDEADAVTAAAAACRAGVTNIWNANTIPEAQAAFDTAIGALDAITPLNIPAWTVNGVAAAQAGQTAAFTATTTDRVLAITPVNPSGTDAEGALGTYPDWSFMDVNGQDAGQAVTRIGAALTTTIAADSDFPVTATIRGRNGCGDSTLTLTIERPA